MRKAFSIVIFVLLFCSPILGQQKLNDVIYLKNGEKHVGKITLQNEQIVMLETNDGKRFQFQTSDIDKITQEEFVNSGAGYQEGNQGSFAGLFQLSGGLSTLKGALATRPSTDFSLAFGTKKAFEKDIFLGLGAGFENVFDGNNHQNISFLPLFAQIKNVFSSKKISPATNVKFGYAFPLQKSYSGGLYLHTSGGASIKTTENSNIYFGLYFQLQQTYGNIAETLPQGIFTSKSDAVINNFGILTAFIF